MLIKNGWYRWYYMCDEIASSNYVDWKPRMEDYLYREDLYDPFLGDKAKLEGISDEKWSNM